MSKKKIFRCQECGYETVIYEGRGFMGQHIEAMSCADCRNIVPLVVGGVKNRFKILCPELFFARRQHPAPAFGACMHIPLVNPVRTAS